MPDRFESKEINELRETLLALGLEDQTISVCIDILGYSTETMEKILYAHTGYRNFDQLDD